MTKTEIRQLAQKGLEAEIEHLNTLLMALKRQRTTERAVKGGSRRSMTAAARKAVSVRMKRYWAERRKT